MKGRDDIPGRHGDVGRLVEKLTVVKDASRTRDAPGTTRVGPVRAPIKPATNEERDLLGPAKLSTWRHHWLNLNEEVAWPSAAPRAVTTPASAKEAWR